MSEFCVICNRMVEDIDIIWSNKDEPLCLECAEDNPEMCDDIEYSEDNNMEFEIDLDDDNEIIDNSMEFDFDADNEIIDDDDDMDIL